MPRVRDLPFYPLGWALRRRRSGAGHSVLSRPGWGAPQTIALTSASFAPGSTIPDRHSAPGRGPNVSPQLSWTAVPEQTRQLVLVFEDLDLPFDRPGLHSIGLIPPDVTSFAEGALTPQNPSIRWVPTHGGTRTGYSGPRPLPGHGTHHYFFHLFALDTEVPASVAPADINSLDRYVSGRVLGLGTLAGSQHG